MRTKLLILLGVVIFLCIAAVVAVDALLMTDWPKTITERSLSDLLGGAVTIETLQAGWRGDTQMAGVRVELPGGQAGFVHIDTVDVKHQHLAKLLTGQGLGLSSVNAEGAAFHPDRGDGEAGADTGIGNAAIDVTIETRADNPDAQVITILVDDADLGRVESMLTVTEKQVVIDRFDGQLLGGVVSGEAVLDKNAWQQTHMHVVWRELDLQELGKWNPRPDTLEGVVSGEMEICPATDKRPLEPLAINGQVDIKGALFSDLRLGTIRVTGVVGAERILLTDVQIPLLDGLVRGRVRASINDQGHLYYANCDVADIDINLALKAFSENDNDVVGRMNGKGYVVTSGNTADINGVVELQLIESNLVNHPVISTLYNALNLSSSSAKPQGHGRTELRFQGTSLHVADFYYYNRGVEILGAGRVHDFRNRKDSPVEAVVLATTRPLKEMGLPGVDVLDKVMLAAQKDMVSVRVGGTLGEVDVKVTALPQIQSFLDAILGGEK